MCPSEDQLTVSVRRPSEIRPPSRSQHCSRQSWIQIGRPGHRMLHRAGYIDQPAEHGKGRRPLPRQRKCPSTAFDVVRSLLVWIDATFVATTIVNPIGSVLRELNIEFLAPGAHPSTDASASAGRKKVRKKKTAKSTRKKKVARKKRGR